MMKIAKLHAHVLANSAATLSFREFERLLDAFGFTHARTVGRHRQYTNPLVPRLCPVQPSGKESKPYQVRQLLAIIEEYGLGMIE